MDKIYIQIASYRDAELIPTIFDCINKAQYPDRLTFGICFQHDETESLYQFQRDKRFKIVDVHWTESRGLGWARNKLRDLWNGEKYTLQIDSHMRFAKNWDEELIQMMNLCDSEKPILTSYPGLYDPNTNICRDEAPAIICGRYFTDFGTIHLAPEQMLNYENETKPIKARFIAGGYSFTYGIHCKEYKYDPEIYFRGDEISLSVRSYTMGYDIYHPHKLLIWHEYVREGKPKHWTDFSDTNKEQGIVNEYWVDLNNISKKRIQKLLRQVDDDSINLGEFDLGNIRSLEDYEKYAGIKFYNKVLHSDTIAQKYPPINDESEWWLEKINSDDKVSCIMTTYRRFNCVERSISMFLAQKCNVKTELIIYNTDVENPLALDDTFREINNIKIINNNIDFETKKPYDNVGSIRRDALTFADGKYYICWDDDDLFFPWNIQQCIDGLIRTGKKAWKPKNSFMMNTDKRPQLFFNNLEASFIIELESIRNIGFNINKSGAEHLKWIEELETKNEVCVDDLSIPGYCFYWADDIKIGGHKQSNADEFQKPDNFERHKLMTTDFADRKLTLKKINEYKEIFHPFIDLLEEFEGKNREFYYKYIMKNIIKLL